MVRASSKVVHVDSFVVASVQFSPFVVASNACSVDAVIGDVASAVSAW